MYLFTCYIHAYMLYLYSLSIFLLAEHWAPDKEERPDLAL